MNKRYYLAYGSNLNLEQMSFRCPDAKPVGKITLQGYRLLFRGGDHPVATIEPYKNGSVPCLIWEITQKDESALDRYEGFPILYRKEYMEVELDHKPIEALIYIMNGALPTGNPSCYYYSTIRDGYNSAGFDIGVLKQAVTDSMEE